MSRAARLSAFLEKYPHSPIWGVDECTAGPAQWVREEGHRIALPAYGNREEAQAIIARYGSLAQTWSALSGLEERYGEPEMGDVAVIDTRRYGQIGGICARGRVLIIRRAEGGWTWFGPVRSFVKVWAVPERAQAASP